MFPQEMDLLTPPPPLAEPPPPPVNQPEKADFESQNCNEESNTTLQNFRGLMMRLAIASSPYKSLSPTQNAIFEEKLRQCFPYLRAPDHPPYSWMIRKAIENLNDESGSSEEAISESIMSNNPELPWAHSTILRHHLAKLCEKGDIVQTQDGLYLIKEQNDPLPAVPNSPSSSSACSLSFSPSLDYMDSESSSSSEPIGPSKRRQRKRKRKPMRVGIKKKKRRASKKKNRHLVRKKKVRARLPTKVRRKAKVISDEETVDGVEEGNQMEMCDIEMTEQAAKEVSIQDGGEVPMVPTDVGAEDGSDVIEAENDEDGLEMINGYDLSGLEHNVSQPEADRRNGLILEIFGMNAEEEWPDHELDVEESFVQRVENQMHEENVMEQEEVQVEANNAETEVINQDQQEQEEENHQDDIKEENIVWKCGTVVILKENDDQKYKANIVNDTTDAESPKKLGGDESEEQRTRRVLRVCQNREKEIVPFPNAKELGAGRCLRSRTKSKPEQMLVIDHPSIGSDALTYEGFSMEANGPEVTGIEHSGQHEQEMVECGDHHSHMEGEMVAYEDHQSHVEAEKVSCEDHQSHVEAEMAESDHRQSEPQFPTEEAEETLCSQFQQNDMSMTPPKVGEQPNHRELRHHSSMTEPGTEEDQGVLQSGLSLPETRRVTRKMAAATASSISPSLLDEKPKPKHSKSQVDGEVSSAPRRSARLSIGPSKK